LKKDEASKSTKLCFKWGRVKGILNTESDEIKINPPFDVPLKYKFNFEIFKDLVKSLEYNSDVVEETGRMKPINIIYDGTNLKCSTNDIFTSGIAKAPHEELQKFKITMPMGLVIDLLKFIKTDFAFGLSKEAVRIQCEHFDLTHMIVQSDIKLINVEEELSRLANPTASILINKKEILRALEEIKSFSTDYKDEIRLGFEDKECKILLETNNGKIANRFLVPQSPKVKVKISLSVLLEMSHILDDEFTFELYHNKVHLHDSKRNYIIARSDPQNE
jgi:hypothetical protein